MDLIKIIERITGFAADAHKDQTRKFTPDPYIVHPIRVMEICKNYTEDFQIMAAALLHDVLEDTSITKEEMSEFLRSIMSEKDADRTLLLVIELTDIYVKKDYPKWNRRKRKSMEIDRMEKVSGDAQTIKYADIIDNSHDIVHYDKDFARLYFYESRTLLRKINKGNQDLYKKAIKTIDDLINSISEIKKQR